MNRQEDEIHISMRVSNLTKLVEGRVMFDNESKEPMDQEMQFEAGKGKT